MNSDQPNPQRDAIFARLRELSGVQRECEIILNSIDSDFWHLLARTIRLKKDAYLSSAYEVAEKNEQSVRNALGKMEALDWLLTLVESDFREQSERVQQEKISLENQLKEIDMIDKGLESIAGENMYQQPGLI